ncbi:MAG: hypothetical protein H7Y38_00335 [Armatimonadetes bacterium]|nr:hypothetical protein [Armatimonadota bacterium]
MQATSFEIESYDIKTAIRVDAKNLRGVVVVRLQAGSDAPDKITFLLNKKATIKSITLNEAPARFMFDIVADAPNRFIRAGRTLTVLRNNAKSGKLVLRLEYDCVFDEITSDANAFSREWIELGGYSAWFPFSDDYGRFSYTVDVTIDRGMSVSGSGVVTKTGDTTWRLKQSARSKDIVLIASDRLQTRILPQGSGTLRLDFVNLADAKAQELARIAEGIGNNYQKWFGRATGTYTTFALNPNKDLTSYARTGFVSFQIKGMDTAELVHNIGHELAHFWWNHAPTGTWEDWLNESFAEYSAALAARELFGERSLEKTIEQYRKEAEGSPPLRNADRNGKAAFVLLYRKGVIVLHELRRKIGAEKFVSLLAETTKRKTSNTEDFLRLTEKYSSRQTRESLEAALSR